MEKKQEHMRQLLRMVNVYKDAMEHYDRTSKKFPVEGLDYQMLKRPSIFFLNQSRKKDEATGGEKAGSSRKRKAVDGEEKEGEGKEKKDKKEKKKTQKNNEEGMKSGDVVSSVPNKQKKESKRGVAGKDDKVGIVEQASDPMNSVLSTEVERVNKRRLEKEGDNSKFEDRKKKSIVVTAVAVTSEEVLETAVGEEEEALAEVLETAVGGEEEALTEVLEMAVGEEEEALTEVLETAVGEEEEAPAEMLTGKVVSVAVGEFMCEEDFRELFRAVHVQLYIIAKEDSFAYTVLDNDAATTLHRCDNCVFYFSEM
jgi:hypothetical protein